MSDAHRQRSSQRPRGGVVAGIVVLALVLVALLVGIGYLLLDRDPDATPQPDPSLTATLPTPDEAEPTAAEAEPTAAGTTASEATPSETAPSQPPSPKAGQTMMWQGKATFENFTVELLEDTGDADMIEGLAGLPIEVCVTAALEEGEPTRISLEPWRLEDSNGNTQVPQDPGAYEPAFPADATYEVGECAEGYLTFDLITDEVDYVELVYENGLGDRAVWQFH